jgi:hypothetical protein
LNCSFFTRPYRNRDAIEALHECAELLRERRKASMTRRIAAAFFNQIVAGRLGPIESGRG